MAPIGTLVSVESKDDQARFKKMVLPHLVDAYALARWLTGNPADAEDVVQEASLRAFRAMYSFAGGNVRAWLLTITRNAAYSWMAKNRPPSVFAVDDLEAVERNEASKGMMEESETPETALIAKTQSKQLETTIAQLPLPFRETLVLRDVQGLDYREIATMTHVPIGTVMSRLARARQRLMASIARGET
jgi:RNA polymerase sigma-70 factor, ECF subfamily